MQADVLGSGDDDGFVQWLAEHLLKIASGLKLGVLQELVGCEAQGNVLSDARWVGGV